MPKGPWTMLRLWVFICQGGGGRAHFVSRRFLGVGVKGSCQDTGTRHHLSYYPCGGWELVGRMGGCRTEEGWGRM